MKYILPFVFILFLTSCKKEKEIIPTDQESIKKEDPSIEMPAFSATMTTNGSKRIINIIGGLDYINLTVRTYKNNQWGFITYMFDLRYDTLKLTKYPRETYEPVYTFVRNSPYNYTFTHHTQSGENYYVIVNGEDFLNDVIKFEY